MVVKRVQGPEEFRAAIDVRRRVFIEEQDVPEHRELDGQDAEAQHLIAVDDGEAVGTARLRDYGENAAKLERVAVLSDRRGEGWGKRLVATAEATAAEQGRDRVVLDAQTHVVAFYQALGYEVTSDEEFMDAGIPHLRMTKRL